MTTRETEIVDRETGKKRRLALTAWQVQGHRLVYWRDNPERNIILRVYSQRLQQSNSGFSGRPKPQHEIT
jgi:hypothetical protein